MSYNVTMLAVFVAASLTMLGAAEGVWEVFFRRRARIGERMRQEFRDRLRDEVKQSALFRDFAEVAADIASTRPSWRMRWQTLLAQSGVKLTVLGMLTTTSLVAAGFAAIAWFLVGHWLAMPPSAIVGAVVPWCYLHYRRKQRMARLCQQLPEAFDVMSRALRSGLAVPAAFHVVANDFPVPISEEFAYCYEQQHLGIPFEVALHDLARRTGFVETRLFATALIINRQVGGNLAEMLGRLAGTMRTRAKFQARIRALTGEARTQAVVLITLPFVSLMALFVLNRDYAQVLLDRPLLLGLTAASQLAGALSIRKCISLKT